MVCLHRLKCAIVVFCLKCVKFFIFIFYIQLCFSDGEVQSCLRTSAKCVWDKCYAVVS